MDDGFVSAWVNLLHTHVLGIIIRDHCSPIAIVGNCICKQLNDVNRILDLVRTLISPGLMETHRDREEEDRNARIAFNIPGSRSCQLSRNRNAHNNGGARAKCETGVNRSNKMEWIELDQYIETKESIYVETACTRVEFNLGSKLNCI